MAEQRKNPNHDLQHEEIKSDEIDRNLSENEEDEGKPLTEKENGIKLQRIEIIPENQKKIETNDDDDWAPPISTPEEKEFKEEVERFAEELKTDPILGEVRALLPLELESPEVAIREPEYRVFPRRWFVLTVVALLNCANTISWICFAPVANYTDQFYGANAANFLSVI